MSAESKFGGGPGYELTFGRQVRRHPGLEGAIVPKPRPNPNPNPSPSPNPNPNPNPNQVQFYLGLEGLIGCPAGGSAEEVIRATQREH